MNIEKKLSKYQNYVPGEIRSKEYNKKKKRKQRLAEKHLLADEIGESMFLRKHELDTVHYLIDKLPNFKQIHGKASNEAIITAFCFTLVRLRKSSARLHEYKCTGHNGLTQEIWGTVQAKIIGELLKSMPIRPVQTSRYDHEILCSKSLRQAETTEVRE